MSDLKADNLIAMQFLINEDLYLIDPVESMAESAVADTGSRVEVTVTESEPSPTSFDYLGENNKYFVLLVSYPQEKYMPPKELEALQSILGAKKMELKDVALVNISKHPGLNFRALRDFFACNKAVLFGINPAGLQLPAVPSNQITDYQGVKMLATFSFSEMMNDVEKKKQFWNVMKLF